MLSEVLMPRQIALALQFLTICKVRIEPPAELAEVGRSAWAFPVVGAFIGAILVATQAILARYFPVPVTGILVVGMWAALTGGLHLDGWTDCWDSLPASVSPERRREILKDSRLGTFGALGLIMLLALKFATVARSDLALLSIFAAPVLGRGIMVMASYGARHCGDGMAAMFLSGLSHPTAVWAGALGVCPALAAGWSGVLAAAVAYVAAIGFRCFSQSRLRVINGDVMGAMCELSETVFLVTLSARW
jgi:adenosylcobinamide-GDP ribazoletransferase